MRRSPTGLLAALTLFLLPVLGSPVMAAQYFTLKAGFFCVAVGAGAVLYLCHLRQHPSPASIVAGVALLLASASTLFADNRTLAVFGLYNWGTGLIFIVGLVAAWSLGRHADAGARAALPKWYAAALAINAVVAVTSMFVGTSSFPFRGPYSRPPGLLGNSIHLGAFAAGAVVLGLGQSRTHGRRWLPLVVAGAAVVQIAGSRGPLIVIVGFVIWELVRRRRFVDAAVASGAGILVGTLVSALAATSTATGRIGTSGGDAGRLETWYAALHTIAAHPWLGVGPGNLRGALGPLRTLRLVADEPRTYVDAHNAVLHFAATIGVPGMLALAAWALLALRRSSGPLVPVVLALSIPHLLEPLHLTITPLIFLLLGASDTTRLPRLSVPTRTLVAAGAALGLAAGSMLIFGDFLLDQARLDYRADRALRARRLMPGWAEPATLISNIELFNFEVDGEHATLEKSLWWHREAARLEPDDKTTWVRLAFAERYAGSLEENPASPHFERARQAFLRALADDPWDPGALVGLAVDGLRRRDFAAADAYARKLRRTHKHSKFAATVIGCARRQEVPCKGAGDSAKFTGEAQASGDEDQPVGFDPG